jgi:hypothetical protein
LIFALFQQLPDTSEFAANQRPLWLIHVDFGRRALNVGFLLLEHDFTGKRFAFVGGKPVSIHRSMPEGQAFGDVGPRPGGRAKTRASPGRSQLTARLTSSVFEE